MNVFTFSTMLCFANMASSDSINGVRLETCLETVIFTIPIGTTRGVEISHCSLNLYKTKNKPHDIENGLLLLDKTDLLFWGPDVTKPNIVRNQYLYKKAPVCPKEVKTPGIFKHFTLHISQKQQHPFYPSQRNVKQGINVLVNEGMRGDEGTSAERVCKRVPPFFMKQLCIMSAASRKSATLEDIIEHQHY